MPFKRACTGNSSGFTFIEILATLTFVAIVLPAAMRGISIASSAASESRMKSEAAMLANNLIAEFIVAGDFQSIYMSGDFMPEKPGYTWTAEITEWEQSGLKQLAVKVSWISRHSEQSVRLDTLIYGDG